MSDRKPCLKCGRAIDPYAKSCVYCNWDQSMTPPPVPAGAESATVAPPPLPPVTGDERNWRKRILLGIALAVMVVGAFAIGAFVHHGDSKIVDQRAEEAKESAAERAAAPPAPPRSSVAFAPATDSAISETPVTSAPPVATGTNPNGGPEQRTDATALPSTEYATVAQRVKAEQQASRLVDPRSITGAAYAQGNAPMPQRRAPAARPAAAPLNPNAPMASAAAPLPPPPAAPAVQRTPPVPEYQPVPTIRVSRNTTARLVLTVGADGRVKDVNIAEAIPGETPKLIAAVQNWRFRPATENGVPVEGRFSVDISFHGRE